MAQVRPTRKIVIVVVSILAAVVIVVAGSLIASNVQASAAKASYTAAVTQVGKQVKTDEAAHAALTNVETSGFAASATKVVASLKSCLGATATATTTDGLGQLAGFSTLPGAAAVTAPVTTSPSVNYEARSQLLVRELSADQEQTAQTSADTQANLIARDEVNQDLYAIATNVGGTPAKLVSKDKYATSKVKDAYKTSVAGVATVVTQLAPSLKSTRAVKITPAESTALITALTTFATECKAEATSSACHKPKPANLHAALSTAYPDWHAATWLGFDADVPNEVSLTAYTNTNLELSCTSSKLLEEGTVTGALGTRVSAPSFRTSTVPSVKFLQRDINGTTAQWAWVECK